MLPKQHNLYECLEQHKMTFNSVVQFKPEKDKLIGFDFTEKNTDLLKTDISDTKIFCNYINDLLKSANAKFGIGGYNELRVLYSISTLFDNVIREEEPRRLHIGFDIWGEAATEVFAPCDGVVHSFAFNNNFGDYGATIILKHQFDQKIFYTLYGHLSLADLKYLYQGYEIQSGKAFAHFGKPNENGHWPPHLHFQIINNIENYKGDYPGVCKLSEREKYIANCPDPDIILNMRKFISA